MSSTGEQALTRATQQRTRNAEAAVVQALEQARKGSGRVTVAAIAAIAGVSTDFIYRHPLLRPQVEDLRRSSSARTRTFDHERDQDAAASPLVRRLTHQIKSERAEHHAELTRLRAALEAAHGELLGLRRQLADRASGNSSGSP